MSKSKRWIGRGIPSIHLLISVVISSVINQKGAYPTNGLYREMLPLNDIPWSKSMEHICWWLLAIIIGAVLIYIAWSVGMMLFEKKNKMPFLLLGIAFCVCVLIFPTNYAYETDNFLSYSYAIRAMPDYWQSILLGCFYRGCLLVFPHPIIIPFIQLASLLGVICFVSKKIQNRYGKKVAWIPYLLVLVPEFLDIGTNPYRNCIYTVMCLWYYAILLTDAMEGKKRSKTQLLRLCAAAVFLSVFRSEGVFTIFAFVAALIFIYRVSLKKWLPYVLCVCVLGGILVIPQKMGEIKYYGNGYRIVNYMDLLQHMLNNDSVNLDYEGIQEDLAAIDTVVPLPIVISYGMSGYRTNNYVQNGVMNQVQVSADESKAFEMGVRNIILHNIPLYLKIRVAMFYEACTGVEIEQPSRILGTEDEKVQYVQKITEIFEKQNLDYAFSYMEIFGDGYPKGVFVNQERVNVAYVIMGMQTTYYEACLKTGIVIAARLMVFLLFPVLTIAYIRNNKNREKYFWLGVMGVLMSQLLAVFLVSPEGREAYYYPSFFVMLLSAFLLLLELQTNHNSVKSIQIEEAITEGMNP